MQFILFFLFNPKGRVTTFLNENISRNNVKKHFEEISLAVISKSFGDFTRQALLPFLETARPR